jgi:glutathione S-transferase
VRTGGEARLAPQNPEAQALVAACQAAAQGTLESAQRVLDGGSGGAASSLGARAATHMRDRAKARTACAMAAAALGSAGDSAEKHRLSAAVAHADELWQTIPHAVSGQKN